MAAPSDISRKKIIIPRLPERALTKLFCQTQYVRAKPSSKQYRWGAHEIASEASKKDILLLQNWLNNCDLREKKRLSCIVNAPGNIIGQKFLILPCLVQSLKFPGHFQVFLDFHAARHSYVFFRSARAARRSGCKNTCGLAAGTLRAQNDPRKGLLPPLPLPWIRAWGETCRGSPDRGNRLRLSRLKR